jgi:hypothetical protein
VLDELLKAGGSWLINPYHNLSHALRVANVVINEVPEVERTTFLIAALFHDYGHPGVMGEDEKNIERAIQKVLLLPAKPGTSLEYAAELIRGTQFPLPEGMTLTPDQGLLRDADFWHTAFLGKEDWLQVQVGLAAEFGKSLKDWLVGNAGYIETVPTFSKWGRITAEDHRGRMTRTAVRWAACL